MIYLCEREIGFDTTEIGFPSVMGCRAIVLVTAGGLFGYHLNGSLSEGKKTAFKKFITKHVHGHSRRKLYAASSGAGSQADHDELRDIAHALKYAGTIYWASLPGAGSSFVHYQDINHNTCAVTSRQWIDANDSILTNKGKYIGENRAIANGVASGAMYIKVDCNGLVGRYPNPI
ncbi:hypothetical protein ACFOLC_03485 [Lysobacter cavernae]|uniref:Uncharacterized protein n=1 Tax=Lysobacter cavernae TaxID=1685901 RepID=A0ABV7RQ46_9GAMM